MIAEYKGTDVKPPQIPPEAMAEMRYRVPIGHAGPNRNTVLCRDYHWDDKNNRWHLDYALANARVQVKGGQVLMTTLYESMAVVGHPMTIVPLKSTAKEGGAHATTTA